MKNRTLFQMNAPEGGFPEDPHLGVEFEYRFMGQTKGVYCTLLLKTVIYDHSGRSFSRKSKFLLPRIQVRECIRENLKDHLQDLNVPVTQIQGMLRDFKVARSKCLAFDPHQFQVL